MKIELIEKCKSCKGTGVYVGMAERDGYGVVCQDCKGMGKRKFTHEYEEFEQRGDAKIHTILEVNPGIITGGKMDFGGMPYTNWLDGEKFPHKSEMRKFTCPAWWYQSADYDKKPKWDECAGCGSFSACASFPTKNKCWERFDKESK